MEVDTQAVAQLADMCGPAFEFRTRISALSALEALDSLPESVVVNALDAAVHFNARLARQGQGLLEQNWDESLKDQCEGYLSSLDLVPWQVKKWERFLAKMNASEEE